MDNWSKRIIGGLCIVAIVQGIWLSLHAQDIHPEKWVASMIGLAGSALAEGATWWILMGLAGLIGLAFGPAIAETGQKKWRQWFKKSVIPDSLTISLKSMHLLSLENLSNSEKPTHFCDFDVFKFKNNQVCETSSIIPSLGHYLRNRMFASSIGLCVITNYSDVPLFNVKIQIIMDYYRVEDSSPSGLGEPVRHHEMAIRIPNSVLKQKESVAFLVGNGSKYNAVLTFAGYLIARVGNSRESVHVPYTFESDHSQTILMGPGQKEKIARLNDITREKNSV